MLSSNGMLLHVIKEQDAKYILCTSYSYNYIVAE